MRVRTVYKESSALSTWILLIYKWLADVLQIKMPLANENDERMHVEGEWSHVTLLILRFFRGVLYQIRSQPSSKWIISSRLCRRIYNF